MILLRQSTANLCMYLNGIHTNIHHTQVNSDSLLCLFWQWDLLPCVQLMQYEVCSSVIPYSLTHYLSLKQCVTDVYHRCFQTMAYYMLCSKQLYKPLIAIQLGKWITMNKFQSNLNHDTNIFYIEMSKWHILWVSLTSWVLESHKQ